MCDVKRMHTVSARFRLLQSDSRTQGTRMARTHVIAPTWSPGRFTRRYFTVTLV